MNRLPNNVVKRIMNQSTIRNGAQLTKVSKSTRKVTKPKFNAMIKQRMPIRIRRTRTINGLVLLYEALQANHYGEAWRWHNGEHYECCAEWHDDFFACLDLMGIDISDTNARKMTKKYSTNKNDFVSIMKSLDLNTLRAFFAFASGRHIKTLSWENQNKLTLV